MSRRKKSARPLSQQPVPDFLKAKVRPPLAVALGSPAEVAHLLTELGGVEATCFQLDLHQADRLRAQLAEAGVKADVVVAADLWDLPAGFQTVLLPAARGGERELKIDLIEQSYHVLRDHGSLVVWSPYDAEEFFPPQMKKVFGKVHTPPHGSAEASSVLWSTRDGDRPRRRHEVTFQVKLGDGPSCRFVSRPGTFSYGRFDDGARALCEIMEIEPGDRVLDLGCGVGTNGVFASQRAGEHGYIAFVDSNARACALTELNAKANGVPKFDVFATSTVEGPQPDSFDVAIANPPYFANSTIAQLFIRRAKELLTPQGKFFLVTKQPDELGDALLEAFGKGDMVENRGYSIMCV
ncbi:MAG: methyltransferase [Gemmataceae bacterium]